MLDGITDSLGMSLSGQGVGDGQGGLACRGPWGHYYCGVGCCCATEPNSGQIA